MILSRRKRTKKTKPVISNVGLCFFYQKDGILKTRMKFYPGGIMMQRYINNYYIYYMFSKIFMYYQNINSILSFFRVTSCRMIVPSFIGNNGKIGSSICQDSFYPADGFSWFAMMPDHFKHFYGFFRYSIFFKI